MPAPSFVLPIGVDPLLVRGRLEAEEEWEDGPLAPDGRVAEGVALALTEQNQRRWREGGLLGDFAPGCREGGGVGGVDGAGYRGEVVSKRKLGQYDSSSDGLCLLVCRDFATALKECDSGHSTIELQDE